MALIDSLVSYWKLDESSGNAADSHGSNTMTNTGSVAYSAAKINNGATVQDDAGKYFSSSVVSTASNTFGLSMWVNLTGTSLASPFYRNGTISANNGYGIGVGASSGRFDRAGTDNGNYLNLLVDAVGWLPFGSFGGSGTFHVVVTRGATTWTAYINGVVCANTYTYDLFAAPTGSTYIGHEQGSSGAAVRLDEIGFWNKELTEADAIALYNAGTGLAYPLTTSSTVAPPTFFMFN